MSSTRILKSVNFYDVVCGCWVYVQLKLIKLRLEQSVSVPETKSGIHLRNNAVTDFQLFDQDSLNKEYDIDFIRNASVVIDTELEEQIAVDPKCLEVFSEERIAVQYNDWLGNSG